MKRTILSVLLGLAVWSLRAQEETILQAALYLSGAATEEEIPADLPDRLEAEPPVRVNSPYLKAGLLLTDYQVACIRDYRAAHGDILSAAELALVDGFGADAATALAPFLSFTSSRLPGQPDSLRPTPRATALLRGTLTTFGGKLKASGESALSWRVGGAWRRSGIWSGLEAGTSKGGGSAGTTDGSFYADATLGPWRLLIGHFNTRWGQGLAAWSGFGMESLSTLSAFIKRPTGISSVWSYAPSSVHRGLALEYSAPRFRAQAFAGLDHDYGFHTDLLGRSSQLGFTFLWASSSTSRSTPSSSTSRSTPSSDAPPSPGTSFGLAFDAAATFALDARISTRHALLTAELAYHSRSIAFKTATTGRLSDAWKWSAQARMVPRRYSGKKYGEYAAALGLAYTSPGTTSTATSHRSSSTATSHRSSSTATSHRSSSTATSHHSSRTDQAGTHTAQSGTSTARTGPHTASLTADASFLPIPGTAPRRFQLRIYSQWQWQFSPHWLLDTRITERYRNYESPRTALRLDLKYTSSPTSARSASTSAHPLSNAVSPSANPSQPSAPDQTSANPSQPSAPDQTSAYPSLPSATDLPSARPGIWLATARLETVRCGKWGVLAYLEGGRKNETSAMYLRVTGFSVSAWDARIYCYERDAPGTFSVPAYNGHGIAFSAVGSLKLQPFRNLRHGHPLRYFSLKGNLRTACQLRTDRRPTYTLALQLQADL